MPWLHQKQSTKDKKAKIQHRNQTDKMLKWSCWMRHWALHQIWCYARCHAWCRWSQGIRGDKWDKMVKLNLLPKFTTLTFYAHCVFPAYHIQILNTHAHIPYAKWSIITTDFIRKIPIIIKIWIILLKKPKTLYSKFNYLSYLTFNIDHERHNSHDLTQESALDFSDPAVWTMFGGFPIYRLLLFDIPNRVEEHIWTSDLLILCPTP